MVNKPRKSSAKRNRSRIVIIIQSTSAIGPKHRRCNLKHLRSYKTLAMKTEKEKTLRNYLLPEKCSFLRSKQRNLHATRCN